MQFQLRKAVFHQGQKGEVGVERERRAENREGARADLDGEGAAQVFFAEFAERQAQADERIAGKKPGRVRLQGRVPVVTDPFHPVMIERKHIAGDGLRGVGLVAGQDSLRAHPQTCGERGNCAPGVRGRMGAGLGVGAQPGEVAPDFFPVGPLLDEQRPPWKRLARILLAGGFKHRGARKCILHQLPGQPARIPELRRSERGGEPFRSLGLKRHKRGFTAHGEQRAVAGE